VIRSTTPRSWPSTCTLCCSSLHKLSSPSRCSLTSQHSSRCSLTSQHCGGASSCCQGQQRVESVVHPAPRCHAHGLPLVQHNDTWHWHAHYGQISLGLRSGPGRGHSHMGYNATVCGWGRSSGGFLHLREVFLAKCLGATLTTPPPPPPPPGRVFFNEIGRAHA
jgi:hypothetical protein